MIVDRKPLNLWERLYVPAVANGFKVTWRHFKRTVFEGRNAADDTAGGYYPEVPWKVEPGYRGAPYLVRDQEGKTKCVSCQLCEFICPPRAITITPGELPKSDPFAKVEKAPREFKIDMIRCIYCGLCEEVCPEQAIFLKKEYSITGYTRKEMVNNKGKLLEMGGVMEGLVYKWNEKK
jgi:NADH-quinone oxidoreductase subunit I